jgi:hypothetical protein
MKKLITITLLCFCYNISPGQTQPGKKDTCDTFLWFLKTNEELLKYIDNPCPNDSSCKMEISKAKSEIAEGKITFCSPQSLMIFDLRQEQQLRQLCKSHGLNFVYEYFSDIGATGQTQGCYGLYMDKIIAQKFGSKFKDNLLREADSLYVLSNPTVYYTKCDTLPRLTNKDIFASTEMDVKIGRQLFDKLKVSQNGYYPQVDVGFYIDTIGNASNYFVSQFIIYDDIKENNRFKKKLIEIALGYIKQFKIWKPGIILNRKVKTEYNVRLSFVSETK